MNADRKSTREQDRKMVYELDGRPSLSTAVPLGLQHVLAMFTSNLAPILIIAGVCGLSGADTVTMVQCAMFVSGLTTFIQLYPLRLGSGTRWGRGSPLSWAPPSPSCPPPPPWARRAASGPCWGDAWQAA